MRERGNAVPQVGLWWLRLARRLVANDSRDLVTMGRDLAKHVDKKQPFDKGTLSRFIKGTGPVTFQLIQALCAEFTRLPTPIVFPDSYEEAVAMLALAAVVVCWKRRNRRLGTIAKDRARVSLVQHG
jgi:hypothetical protein